MLWYETVVISALLCLVQSHLTIPKGFKFGAATSAYQVEGAWNASDKSASIWDTYFHSRAEIYGTDNGDIACNSYQLWKRDVEILKDLGMDMYRFSISWPRLLPSGFANYISEDGKTYYNNLIDELLLNGIQPAVTIYHWDLPQRLQNLGGWTNPLVVEWFADYSRVVYNLFGDRVKIFFTFNEPLAICELCYAIGISAPALKDTDVGQYLCSKHVLLAHATAWRIYDEEFRPKYHGRVTIVNQIVWLEPLAPEFEKLTEQARQLSIARYIHPIYSKEGGWPPVMEEIIAENSRQEGFPRSRLPALTKDEIDFIRGTYDFFAVNHYTSRLVRHNPVRGANDLFAVLGASEIGVDFESDPSWLSAEGHWLKQYPEGLRYLMKWLKENYGDIEFMITENGSATYHDDLDDEDRVMYFKKSLEQILIGVHEDKLNVTGYFAWSLMDNLEWMHAYNTKFGIYRVDFNDPQRTRTPKKSALYLKNVIKTRSLDIPTEYKDEL